MKIAVVLRGHERDVFLNSRLYNFVKQYSSEFDIDLYIHTWNKSVGEFSWRDLSGYAIRYIDEKAVREYFKELPIKKLMIDDEKKIQLNGNIYGNVCSGPCPKIAWKRMWYGKYRIMNHIRSSTNLFYDFVLNMRFDIFQNINNIFSEQEIIDKTRTLLSIQQVNQIYFLKDEPCSGIDNCYFGNQTAIFFLTEMFNYNLDEIAKLYANNFYTEYLVYFEALKQNYRIWMILLEKTHNVTRIRIE